MVLEWQGLLSAMQGMPALMLQMVSTSKQEACCSPWRPTARCWCPTKAQTRTSALQDAWLSGAAVASQLLRGSSSYCWLSVVCLGFYSVWRSFQGAMCSGQCSNIFFRYAEHKCINVVEQNRPHRHWAMYCRSLWG